uniref:Uncharacterized protein n=1 Tax=Anguilla anguilla TaxID=7936 RepID=A0A0E9STX5_ANGAN
MERDRRVSSSAALSLQLSRTRVSVNFHIINAPRRGKQMVD